MPVARFQLPDGKIGRFQVPDGTTPEQAQKMISENLDTLLPKSENVPRETPAELAGNDAGEGAAFVYGANEAVPFGRKITSAIGAGLAMPFTDESFKDLYNQAEADTAATAEANPVSNIAGNVAGIAGTLPLASSRVLAGSTPVTGFRGAINKIPQAFGAVGEWNNARTFSSGGRLAKAGNVTIQAGKNALTAVPAGALYGAGQSKTGEELQGAVEGAGVGAGIGFALPVASAAALSVGRGLKNTARGSVAQNAEKLAEASEDKFSKAGDLYRQMREAGAVLNPASSGDLSIAVNRAVNAPEFIPELNPKTTAVVNAIKNRIQTDGGIELGTLDQYRRLLGKIGNSEDGISAGAVRSAIDGHVNSLEASSLARGDRNAIDLLNKGRSAYQQASKFDAIADIIEKSAGDANKQKNALARFLSNDKNTRGWSKDELSALKEAANNSTGEGLLKLAGKFGIDLGSSRAAGSSGIGALVLSGVTAANAGMGAGGLAVAGGTAARQLQKWVARGKSEELLRIIEAGGKLPAGKLKSLPPADARRLIAIQAAMTLGGEE